MACTMHVPNILQLHEQGLPHQPPFFPQPYVNPPGTNMNYIIHISGTILSHLVLPQLNHQQVIYS